MFARWSQIDDCVNTLIGGTLETLNRTDAPHDAILRFLKSIEWNTNDFAKFVTEQNDHFRKTISQSTYPQTTHRIPKNSHRIWFTSVAEPFFPPDEYIESLVDAINLLPKEWSYFFWTNSEPVASYIRQRIQDSNCRLLVCRFDFEFCNERLFETVTKFIDEKKYVIATDITKFMVLDRFGGIYADLGIKYDENILHLADLSDCILLLGTNLFFQTCFLAMPPRCDLSLGVLGLMNHPEAFDREYILSSAQRLTAIDEVRTFAGAGVTIAALLFLATSGRNIVLPPQSKHLQWRSHGSWYKGEGKFGNIQVDLSQPTVLKLEKYDEYANQSDSHLKIFGRIGLAKQKLKILMALYDFFDENETRLQELLYYRGSDKARGWHNYAYVYNYLFNSLCGRAPLILEIGIGTNNPDVPSSMGPNGIPGASLRAWREYFHSNKIAGADVDKHILFEEIGIKTFFVDQTKPDTIKELFARFQPEKFDVIIDDGLHTFQANVNVLGEALPNLKSGGVFVIEDVLNEHVKRWEKFFAATNLNAVIVTPPNLHNKNDNRFIIIFK